MGPRICLCLPVTGGGMMTPGCCLGKKVGRTVYQIEVRDGCQYFGYNAWRHVRVAF